MDKRFTQSPRAQRDSTEELKTQGKVNSDFRDGPDAANQGAYDLFDKSGNVKQDRGSDAVRSV
jgi:hypothetical protein